MSNDLPSTLLSVCELNAIVAKLLTLQIGQIKLTGEISGFSRPASGHWYFSLRDSKAQIRCAMFRPSQFGVRFFPQNGQQVIVEARASLYEPRGEYQLIIESMQMAGDGDWQIQFEKLKQKLNTEGLFSLEFKKPLPHFAKQIGIVTSSTGAALYDVLQIIKRRDPRLSIIIYPAMVQGKEAPLSLVRAIEMANLRAECDLLIVGRGGGSPEDLYAFNDESVVRAIFASDIPIVSAVGHETDITLADLVADLRAPTPSAAAEMVSRNQQEQQRHYQEKLQRLEMALDYFFSKKQQHFARLEHRLRQQHPQLILIRQQVLLTSLQHRLNLAIKHFYQRQKNHFEEVWKIVLNRHPATKINDKKQLFQEYQYRILQAQQRQFNDYREKFRLLTARINTMNPLATLARGYTITLQEDGKILNNMNKIQIGDKIKTQFSEGWIESRVISKRLKA